jgi:hypothetical protein
VIILKGPQGFVRTTDAYRVFWRAAPRQYGERLSVQAQDLTE